MSSGKQIAEFPDLEAKLQKLNKQSAFERQKAEAEAKRRREAAETEAVYKDFVKSFDHDDDEDDTGSPYGSARGPRSRFGPGPQDKPAFGSQAPFGGGTGKRHFGVPTGTPLKSGPGSLGPVPSSLSKKRPPFGGAPRDPDEGHGRPGWEDREGAATGVLPVSRAFNASDDEEDTATTTTGRAEEKAISKPTLRLANLPPNTSQAAIKALIPSSLTLENVKIVPPSGPSGTERKSITAIVTLSKETPAADIDAVVSALQNRYLGFGFFLNLHRHLSSAAISSNLTNTSSSTTVSYPFGAKRVDDRPAGQGSHGGRFGRGIAPPSSYGPHAGVNRGNILHVTVSPPQDIKMLRMIHRVVELVLQHGPEFEALLMSRPDVQRDEKWAWIWDARSEGGIWYRWRLWEVATGSRSERGRSKFVPLFEDSHAWRTPTQPLSHEYVTSVDEIIDDSDYNSSDDDDEFEDDAARQGEGQAQEDTFLNPVEKAKLVHLLARLPTTLSKVRKGDIARVTAFAITHASRGADEIVDLIVSNIEQPFAYSSANPEHRPDGKQGDRRDEDAQDASPAPEDRGNLDKADTSAARLIGLYVVNDILASSSTSGIRRAWRYRNLFESALRRRKTFEVLGAMAEQLNWGRLRSDKWKRSVGLLLNLWEGWCVFKIEEHEYFVKSFENPPSLRKEPAADEAAKKVSRWKTVEGSVADGATNSGFLPVSQKPDMDDSAPLHASEYIENLLETGDTDGEIGSPKMPYSPGIEAFFSDDDIDGQIIQDDLPSAQDTEMDTKMGEAEQRGHETGADHGSGRESTQAMGFQMSSTRAAPPRKRMRAVDLFAGSDSDDGRP